MLLTTLRLNTAAAVLNASANITESPEHVASSSTVLITPTLSATEVGDTLTNVSIVSLSASVSIAESADSTSDSDTVLVQASTALSEAADTLATSATAPVSASATVSEAGDTLISSVVVGVVGTASYTESADSAASADTTLISAQVLSNEGADYIVNSSSSVSVQLNETATESWDQVTTGAVVGVSSDVTCNEYNDTLTGNTSAIVVASLSATEAQDTLTASLGNTAEAVLSESADSAVGSVNVSVTPSVSVQEQSEQIQSFTAVVSSAAVTSYEVGDVLSSSSYVTTPDNASLLYQEIADSISATTLVTDTATEATGEQPNTAISSAYTAVKMWVGSTEWADSLNVSASVISHASGVLSEDDSLCNSASTVQTTAGVAFNEQSDNVLVVINTPRASGSAYVVETPDTVVVSGVAGVLGLSLAIDQDDRSDVKTGVSVNSDISVSESEDNGFSEVIAGIISSCQLVEYSDSCSTSATITDPVPYDVDPIRTLKVVSEDRLASIKFENRFKSVKREYRFVAVLV